MIELREHQKIAVAQLSNGKILYGDVGSGKTITALAYYMEKERTRDIYVITTAKKRDSLDWDREAAQFGISKVRDFSAAGKLVVDSWNNVSQYNDIRDAFFVFDEQRVVGSGVWVKSFIKIARKNNWILLSATPGDTWLDYAPVMVANGWYANLTDFKRQHVVYAPYVKFPIVQRYIGEEKLERLRNHLLVEMPFERHTTRHVNTLPVGYDEVAWKTAFKDRWHPLEDRPIKDVGELFRVLRRIVNTDPSRLEMIRTLMKTHPRLIIFYNFDYELEILRGLEGEITVAEWNGHRKQPVPDTEKWVYLVQYTSGSEGWNCTETNAIVLYSLTYSYKNYIQCQGRIDRLDTKWGDLYIYLLVSGAAIDKKVTESLAQKKNFNEGEWARSL
jgi:hypothetical protein